MKIIESLKLRFSKRLFYCCLFITLSFLMVSIAFIYFKVSQPKTAINPQQLVMKRLENIQNNLQILSTEVRVLPTISPETMQTIAHQLDSLQQGLTQISTESSVRKLQDTIVAGNQTILQQIQSIQQTLTPLKQKSSSLENLPQTSLPFKVIGIDSWNDVPEATVMISHTANLMAKNDSLSGWTLIDLSLEPARAIFQNQANQIVKITL